MSELFHRQHKADRKRHRAERHPDQAEQRRRRNHDTGRLERGVGIVQLRHHGQHRNGKHHEKAEKQRRTHHREADALEDSGHEVIVCRASDQESGG